MPFTGSLMSRSATNWSAVRHLNRAHQGRIERSCPLDRVDRLHEATGRNRSPCGATHRPRRHRSPTHGGRHRNGGARPWSAHDEAGAAEMADRVVAGRKYSHTGGPAVHHHLSAAAAAGVVQLGLADRERLEDVFHRTLRVVELAHRTWVDGLADARRAAGSCPPPPRGRPLRRHSRWCDGRDTWHSRSRRTAFPLPWGPARR